MSHNQQPGRRGSPPIRDMKNTGIAADRYYSLQCQVMKEQRGFVRNMPICPDAWLLAHSPYYLHVILASKTSRNNLTKRNVTRKWRKNEPQDKSTWSRGLLLVLVMGLSVRSEQRPSKKKDGFGIRANPPPVVMAESRLSRRARKLDRRRPA